MSSRQRSREKSSSSYEWPTVPDRCSSHNAPTRYNSSKQSAHTTYPSSPVKQQGPFSVEATTQSSNTNIDFQSQYEIKARAPWAEPEDFIPRNRVITSSLAVQKYDCEIKARAPWAEPRDFIPRGDGFTPSSAIPTNGCFDPPPASSRFLDRMNSLKAKRDALRNLPVKPRKPSPPTTGPSPNVPEHQEAQILESLDRLTIEHGNLNSCPSDSSGSSQEETRRPARGISRRLRTPPRYFT
ncbi:hypothetical protein F4824DRAFT_504487 [Ustulina deusta]|nr:hypothetical protein F4824DRAFT_504487 [Ustulina deusta]